MVGLIFSQKNFQQAIFILSYFPINIKEKKKINKKKILSYCNKMYINQVPNQSRAIYLRSMFLIYVLNTNIKIYYKKCLVYNI